VFKEGELKHTIHSFSSVCADRTLLSLNVVNSYIRTTVHSRSAAAERCERLPEQMMCPCQIAVSFTRNNGVDNDDARPTASFKSTLRTGVAIVFVFPGLSSVHS